MIIDVDAVAAQLAASYPGCEVRHLAAAAIAKIE
jgi:hypothetical protein